jgi:hypothetical protein
VLQVDSVDGDAWEEGEGGGEGGASAPVSGVGCLGKREENGQGRL